jgi:hypothetical protein
MIQSERLGNSRKPARRSGRTLLAAFLPRQCFRAEILGITVNSYWDHLIPLVASHKSARESGKKAHSSGLRNKNP